MNNLVLIMLLTTANDIVSTIPDPLKVEEIQNNLVKVSLFLGIISSTAVIISAIVAFVQWKKTKRFHKIEYIQNLRSKIYDDKEVAEVLYKFDYNEPWYSKSFHLNIHPQIEVDKTLSILEYACYLLNKKILEEEDISQINYVIHRAIGNYYVQDYLYNLHHWTEKVNEKNNEKKIKKTLMPFSTLLQYGLDNGFISRKEFNDKTDNSKYHNYLNF